MAPLELIGNASAGLEIRRRERRTRYHLVWQHHSSLVKTLYATYKQWQQDKKQKTETRRALASVSVYLYVSISNDLH
jgi:hypothetical protein